MGENSFTSLNEVSSSLRRLSRKSGTYENVLENSLTEFYENHSKQIDVTIRAQTNRSTDGRTRVTFTCFFALVYKEDLKDSSKLTYRPKVFVLEIWNMWQ